MLNGKHNILHFVIFILVTFVACEALPSDEENPVDEVFKGQIISVPVEEKVRRADKLYKSQWVQRR